MRKRSPQGAVPGVLSAVGSLVGRRRVIVVVVIYAEMPLPLVMGGCVWVFYCEQAIERPNERQSKQASWLVGWQVEGEWTGEGRMSSKEVEDGGWKLSEAAWSAGWSGMVRSVVREGKVCGKAVQSSARSGWRRHREAPARRSLAWDFEFLSAKTEN